MNDKQLYYDAERHEMRSYGDRWNEEWGGSPIEMRPGLGNPGRS